MRSSVATMYTLGFAFHDGWLTAPVGQCVETPRHLGVRHECGRLWQQRLLRTTPRTFPVSRKRKPACGGKIGGTGAPGGGSLMRVATDSPASGTNAAT